MNAPAPATSVLRDYAFYEESRAVLEAPIDDVFRHLDDFRKLSAHMERSSGMMLGSKMSTQLDGAGGRAVGSKVRMHGRVMGLPLALEEVVVERVPPLRKVWETVQANLLVIGRYRLGFELAQNGGTCAVRAFINYDLPDKWPVRLLGGLFGPMYARWCTERMVADATNHFRRYPG